MEHNEEGSQRKGKCCPPVPRPPSRIRGSGRETVEFSVRGPLPVNIDEEPVTIPGCSILDIVFAQPSVVGELTLRNYYTASLSVLVRMRNEHNGPWTLSIPRKELMPSPHLEHGSHSFVSIVVTESSVEWNTLMAMRLVLRQPSPVWRVFHVEELNVYADLPRLSLKNDAANCGQQQQQHQLAHGQLQHQYDKMLGLVRRQTLAALSWMPSDSSPHLSSLHKGPCGYELSKLPHI